MKKMATIIGLILLLTSCAGRAEYIEPLHMSDERYDGWSCAKLANEVIFVDDALAKVSKKADDLAAGDTMMRILVGVPISNGSVKYQVSSLKGEKIALASALGKRRCNQPNALQTTNAAMTYRDQTSGNGGVSNYSNNVPLIE